MKKIAVIGAGSRIFCKTLTMDILATPAFCDAEIRLMSRTRPKLDEMEQFISKVITENALSATVWSTTDRREAIKGADYVICMIQVGGLEAYRCDYEIPLRYGVDQCIGDSMGPGGIFRGLRSIPVLMDMADDIAELAPDALLLTYVNPMATCCLALGKSPVRGKYVGLCHGIQTTLDLISRYVGVDKEKIDYICAGINHMAWFLSLYEHGSRRDLYPLLKENMERPEYYANEKVRGEVMRHFGYFMTESTGHLSEYVPWFRSSRKSLELYCDEPGFGGESGAYYKYCSMLAEKYCKSSDLAHSDCKLKARSVEYCSYILEAHTTGKPFQLNGNVANDGYISNLPHNCCVEVPMFVDSSGFHPVFVGDLPPQCAALNQSNVTVQTLAAEAALTGDPELVVQAVALDPLTSTQLTLAETREMVKEMLAAEAIWLPQFSGKKLRSTPTISIPANLERVDVPLDPALAIVHRFSELATPL